MTSTNFTNLLKIRLKRGQKYPVEKWTAVKNQYKKINTDEYNAGVPMKPNNLVGVDLDSAKWGANHIWYEKFGADIEAYCKLLNTLTVRTPSGGYHLYFKYHENLPQTQSAEYQIDIRRDNGFLVCPPSFTDVGKYETINDAPPTDIPEALCEFLHSILYDKSEKEKIGKSKKMKELRAVKRQRTGKEAIRLQYKYVISDEEFENRVLKKLDRKYFTDYTYWVKFTTAMKHLGKRVLWEHYCSANKGFDEEKNEAIWNANNTDFCMVEHLLKATNSYDILAYCKFKPLPRTRKYRTKRWI